MGQKTRRRGRLSRSADFDRVYREGRAHANRHMVLYVFDRNDKVEGSGMRLGLSVSRKIGGSKERNHVRRLLKEAFWSVSGLDSSGRDFVLIARPEIGKLVESRGLDGVKESMSEVVEAAGLLEGG